MPPHMRQIIMSPRKNEISERKKKSSTSNHHAKVLFFYNKCSDNSEQPKYKQQVIYQLFLHHLPN
jgi:hypothetical protein